MQKYTDLKNNNQSSSAIMEALNRGNGNSVSNFGSVTDFLQGVLGNNFINKQILTSNKNDEIIIPEDIYKKEDQNYNPDSQNNYIQNLEDIEDEENESMEDDIVNDSEHYKIYRDKEEIFECNVSIKGAKLSSTQIRLIIDHDICNLVFYGKVYKEGKCKIPLKKMTFYPEGSMGRMRLEVVVDDSIFIPWEETFIVEGSKKVKVEIKPQNSKKVEFRF
jgi:hypothetical protein